MKVLPFKIPKPKSEALIYQEDRARIFYDQLHQHQEIQISLVVKGSGSFIVADTINEYKENDILVIGEYVPHVFKSDSDKSDESIMCSLFFKKEAFGKHFFELPDMAETKVFFTGSEYGLKVLSKKRTNKTFFQFLIEIRIDNACKLINSNPDLAISLISEQCGFRTIANFNRKFKEIKGTTPTDYRGQRNK